MPKIIRLLFVGTILACSIIRPHLAVADTDQEDIAQSANLYEISFTAGVVMENGDVKNLARQEFILLNRNKDDLWMQGAKGEDHDWPTLEGYLLRNLAPDSIKDWCLRVGFIPQTIAHSPYYVEWIPNPTCRPATFIGEIDKEFTLTELFPVEELKENKKVFELYAGALSLIQGGPSVPDIKLKDINPKKYQEKMDKLWSGLAMWQKTLDETKSPSLELDRQILKSHILIEMANTYFQVPYLKEQVDKCTVGSCVTDLQGRGTFTCIPPGTYWITSLGHKLLGRSQIIWNYQIVIQEDGTVLHQQSGPVILSNDNAASIL